MGLDYTTFYVLIGASLIGGLSGIISIYIVFRERSLLGDVISHAALPGIVFIFLLTQTKNIGLLLLGAIISSILSLWLIHQIIQYKKLKLDAAFAVILSVFFGLGILLLSYIQKTAIPEQAGLQVFLFGQASSLIQSDIVLLFWITSIIIFLVLLFWKELKLLSFDAEYMTILHFPVRYLSILLDLLIVIAIVIGLKTVGVILMAAMVIAPAAAARQWVSSFSLLALLSFIFGSTAGGLGALISSFWIKTPTGPIIIIILTTIVLVSISLAPKKGLLRKWFEYHKRKQQFLLKLVLQNMYALSLQHKNPHHPHSEKVIGSMSQISSIRSELKQMQNLGWIKLVENNKWQLTEKGINQSKQSNLQYSNNHE